MTQSLTDWDEDVVVDPEAEYQALLRTIRWTNGFGLSFVRCSPAEADRLIERIQQDLGSQKPPSESQKKIDVLRLEQPIDNLYEIVVALPNKDQIDVLFITGIDKSLIADIKPGYQGEGEYYNLNTLPRILGHLNLQRERFRDDFDICFIFLVPLFALKYFTRRAPDFFDWRSGVWEFRTDAKLLQQEASKLLLEGSFQEYVTLSSQERTHKILEIRELLDEIPSSSNQRSGLFFELGTLFAAEADYQSAIRAYDQALNFKPNYHQAWYNRGIAYNHLEMHQEAVASCDKALELQPSKYEAWNNRGVALVDLGRYTEAVESFDKALKYRPDYPELWNNRGVAFENLGQYAEAISSFDRALAINSNDIQAHYNRGIAFGKLDQHEKAISSWNKVIEIKPDEHKAWYNKGVALFNLGMYEEALESWEQTIEIEPNFHEAWTHRGSVLGHLGLYEEAITSYNKALKIKPDLYETWNKRGIALGHLDQNKEAISSFDKTLEIKPDFYEAWNNRGAALDNIGRHKEAVSNYNKALELKPNDPMIFYNKACCYALQSNTEDAIEYLSLAIALAPDEYREMAKTNSDFDSIRDNEAFEALLTS